jgi:hypothetical protein
VWLKVSQIERATPALRAGTVHFESISFRVQAQGFMVFFLPFGS